MSDISVSDLCQIFLFCVFLKLLLFKCIILNHPDFASMVLALLASLAALVLPDLNGVTLCFMKKSVARGVEGLGSRVSGYLDYLRCNIAHCQAILITIL